MQALIAAAEGVNALVEYLAEVWPRDSSRRGDYSCRASLAHTILRRQILRAATVYLTCYGLTKIIDTRHSFLSYRAVDSLTAYL